MAVSDPARSGAIGHLHPTIDLARRIPVTQILLQTTALILYGRAASNGQHPVEVSPPAVYNWAAERMRPLPPHPGGSMTNTQWVDADRQWRGDLDRARIRHDLAQLLRRAGHTIPDADLRSPDRYSADPVAMVWIDLADTDPPDSLVRYSVFEQFPVPWLALGVTALNEFIDDHD